MVPEEDRDEDMIETLKGAPTREAAPEKGKKKKKKKKKKKSKKTQE